MANGEEEAGSSRDFLKQFRLETKGCCFVCFGEIEGDAEAGGDNSSTSVSLHKAFRHLKVDMGKVIETLAGGTGAPNIPSSTYSTLLKQTEIIASLCNNCKTIEETFVELVEMEEKIRLEKLNCLEQIQGRFREPERNQRREQEYRQRMTSDIGSMLFLWIVEELRKEVAEKCRLLTSAGGLSQVATNSEEAATSSASTGNTGRHQEDSNSDSRPELKMETEEEQNQNGNNQAKDSVTAGEIMLVDISSDEEEEQQQTEAHVPQPAPPPPSVPETSTSVPTPGPASPLNDQTCPVCGDQFKFAIGLIKHMEITGHKRPGSQVKNQTVPPEEPPPKTKDNTVKNLATPVNPHLPNASGSTKPSKTLPKAAASPPKKKHKCERCLKWFSQRSNLTVHRVICSGSRLNPAHSCETCGKSFKEKRTLKEHFARVHLGKKPVASFQCNLCDRKFTHLCYLKTHRKEVHFRVRFQCGHPGCGKSFSRNYNLRLHKKMEHDGEPEEETVPSSSSFSIPPPPASSIVSEQAYSVDLFPVSASQALNAPREDPLQFLPYDSLPQHPASSQPDVEVVDPSCPPPTSSARKTKPRCSRCLQKYSSERGLKVHQLICKGIPKRAHGTLLYECKLCGKGFRNSSTLAGHRYRVHLNVRSSFPCQSCGKDFKSRGGLGYHIGRVHQGLTYQCEVPGCGKRFKDKNYLKIHEKLKHREGTSPTTGQIHPVHFLEPFLGNGETAGGMPSTPRRRKRGGKRIRYTAPTCQVCGKRFTAKHGMLQHMKNVHLGHRYGCTVGGCGKSYADAAGLRRHMKHAHQTHPLGQPEK